MRLHVNMLVSELFCKLLLLQKLYSLNHGNPGWGRLYSLEPGLQQFKQALVGITVVLFSMLLRSPICKWTPITFHLSATLWYRACTSSFSVGLLEGSVPIKSKAYLSNHSCYSTQQKSHQTCAHGRSS